MAGHQWLHAAVAKRFEIVGSLCCFGRSHPQSPGLSCNTISYNASPRMGMVIALIRWCKTSPFARWIALDAPSCVLCASQLSQPFVVQVIQNHCLDPTDTGLEGPRHNDGDPAHSCTINNLQLSQKALFLRSQWRCVSISNDEKLCQRSWEPMLPPPQESITSSRDLMKYCRFHVHCTISSIS